jgi:GNAT superfamily N-acetyltransferase
VLHPHDFAHVHCELAPFKRRMTSATHSVEFCKATAAEAVDVAHRLLAVDRELRHDGSWAPSLTPGSHQMGWIAVTPTAGPIAAAACTLEAPGEQVAVAFGYVQEPMRRQGVGSRLLAEVRAWATRCGRSVLLCHGVVGEPLAGFSAHAGTVSSLSRCLRTDLNRLAAEVLQAGTLSNRALRERGFEPHTSTASARRTGAPAAARPRRVPADWAVSRCAAAAVEGGQVCRRSHRKV